MEHTALPAEVWLAIPSASAENCARTLPEWRARGYRIALLQDRDGRFDADADLVVAPFDRYPGYGRAIDHLIRSVVPRTAPIIVTGGDDMLPDMAHTASEIAAQFLRRFPDTFGVMQPVGDRYGGTAEICGSPWIGREFARRMYLGRGAYCRSYFQLYEDQELHDVAEGLGLLWKRPDLAQFHLHWAREGGAPPAYLAGSLARQEESRALYEARRASAFPGHRPLRAAAGAARPPAPAGALALSVLVPSVPSRIEGMLLPLLAKLEAQAAGRADVEILTLCDNKMRSIGLKRDALLRAARGEFCAFVDDDDDVSDDYIESIVGAIRLNPDADVITFDQQSRINDGNPYRVRFSIAHENEPAGRDEHGRWRDIRRAPFHVCAWRTAVARLHAFPDASYGEDWHWAKRAAIEVRREARIDKVLHYYFYRDAVTEAQHTYPASESVA